MDIDRRFEQAIQSYWDTRLASKAKQLLGGKRDAGARSEVTGGIQMGAIESLVGEILGESGMNVDEIRTRSSLELPGYYRGEKKWDLLVVSEGQLVVAMEFKSQAGPSFGNNFNNVRKKPLAVPRIFG